MLNLKAMAGLLNEGGSIFGELGENVAQLDILKNHVDTPYILGAFEVRTKTKKHNSPYVTMELSIPPSAEQPNHEFVLFSGYATALGTKLAKLAKEYGKLDGNHAYIKDRTMLPIFFKINKSQAGEYLDMYAVEEE